jgi:hypothetical protein
LVLPLALLLLGWRMGRQGLAMLQPEHHSPLAEWSFLQQFKQ